MRLECGCRSELIAAELAGLWQSRDGRLEIGGEREGGSLKRPRRGGGWLWSGELVEPAVVALGRTEMRSEPSSPRCAEPAVGDLQKTIGRSLLTAGWITPPRLIPVITELVPVRRIGAGSDRCSKQFVVGRITHFPAPGIPNCRMVALLVLQSDGDGFIKI